MIERPARSHRLRELGHLPISISRMFCTRARRWPRGGFRYAPRPAAAALLNQRHVSSYPTGDKRARDIGEVSMTPASRGYYRSPHCASDRLLNGHPLENLSPMTTDDEEARARSTASQSREGLAGVRCYSSNDRMSSAVSAELKSASSSTMASNRAALRAFNAMTFSSMVPLAIIR
jgi:hypothetical protein